MAKVDEVIKKEELYSIINSITPLNNEYRDLAITNNSGNKILCIMWQVGDILDKFIAIHQIKPHSLYWKIYGKAEGLRNSYITRDFLSYCLRIRRYFKSSDLILKEYPNLKKYSLFREAFPLLENPKYRLVPEDIEKIKHLLNSDLSTAEIKKYLVNYKKIHIGKTNTRTQKLSELKEISSIFLGAYKQVSQLIVSGKLDEINSFRRLFHNSHIKTISQAISALTQENLFVPDLKHLTICPKEWKALIVNIDYLFKSSVEVRNRFRRLVKPKIIFEFAEMLNAITTDEELNNFRRSNNR
jgi:hypothetical protein